MKINIKKMIAEGKLTGEFVGRTLLEDMINQYREDENIELLSNKQKQEMIKSLSENEISEYKKYKNIYDLITNLKPVLIVQNQAAHITFLKINHIIDNLMISEEANNFAATILINHDAFKPFWKSVWMAESVIDFELVSSNIEHLIEIYEEHYVIVKIIEILGELIGIKDLELTIIHPDEKQIDMFNSVIVSALQNIKINRYGFFERERPAEELKEELRKELKTIDIENLKLDKKTIDKAKRIVNLETAQGDFNYTVEKLLSEKGKNEGKNNIKPN